MNFKPKVVIFHCINSFTEKTSVVVDPEDIELKCVKMACSGMVKDVFLLNAFEAGADAVIVFVCPEGVCRHIEGNIRAKKRVGWVGNILDQIGLDHRRLSLFNMTHESEDSAKKAIQDTLAVLSELGPNPAAPNR